MNFIEGFRGPVQIRTGVGAFAELSLAARPQDLIVDANLAKLTDNAKTLFILLS